MKKKNFTKHLWLSITLIFSLLIVTISATYSWFLYQRPNTAYDIEVSVADTFNLTLKSGYSGEEKITSNLDDDFRLQPVYGNGKTFYAPQFGNVEIEKGEFVYTATGEYEQLSDAEFNAKIFKMDFAFVVDSYVDLYLEYTDHETTRTFVSMGDNHETRKSPYGDFSRDNINGAVRVAILQNGVVKCIWIPNSDVELYDSGEKLSIVTGDEAMVEPKYTFSSWYDNQTKKMHSLEIETNLEKNGHCVVDDILYIWGDITDGNCPVISRIYGEQAFSIIMWIDGTDRECTNALIGGKVKLNLCFTAKDFAEQEN